jgi:ATP-binding cassette subfamily F protein 3
LSSVDALIEALQQFEGTLIFISHDVHFIRSIANHVVHVRAGRLTHYPGGYDYYLDKTRQAAREGLTGSATAPVHSSARPGEDSAAPADSASRREQKRAQAELRQARSRERRDLQRRVSALETEIAELEAREKELVRELEQPETYSTPGRAVAINRELHEIHALLPERHREWEQVAVELQAFEA